MVQISPSLDKQEVDDFLGQMHDMAHNLDTEHKDDHIVVGGTCNGTDVLVLCIRINGPQKTMLVPVAVSATVGMDLKLTDPEMPNMSQYEVTSSEAIVLMESIQRGDHGDN